MKEPLTIIFAGDKLDSPLTKRSIFLAGPTPRSVGIAWRPAAINYLEELGFDGTVLVPERRDWGVRFDYEDQIEWELQGLNSCGVIAFWVPRSMHDMPALTTNVEFGMFIQSGRTVYGRPGGASHVRYLDHLYRKYANGTPLDHLGKLMELAYQRADLLPTGL